MSAGPPRVSGAPLRVVIAGAGVAGLEAALALRDLAGARARVTVLAPEPEFVYRPMEVGEAFGGGEPPRHTLAEIADDVGFELRRGAFEWLAPEQRTIHTDAGETLSYDVLLLAIGAHAHPRFRYALTLRSGELRAQLQELIAEIDAGGVSTVAFVAPGQMPWPLPLYELALFTSRHARSRGRALTVRLLTAEDAPLAVFGQAASRAVQQLLDDNGVVTICGTHCETPRPSALLLHPSGRWLESERIVALPELYGPSTPGVPKHGGHGFIPVDPNGRVPHLDGVYAAGDATEFPVKHGAIAAQQADVAAESIAALAGVPIEPTQFHPRIFGMLIGGQRPLYLSAYITGGHGSDSWAGEHPAWSPAEKIVARYLTPYLAARPNGTSADTGGGALRGATADRTAG